MGRSREAPPHFFAEPIGHIREQFGNCRPIPVFVDCCVGWFEPIKGARNLSERTPPLKNFWRSDVTAGAVVKRRRELSTAKAEFQVTEPQKGECQVRGRAARRHAWSKLDFLGSKLVKCSTHPLG